MNSSLHLQAARGLETIFQDYGGPSFAVRLWDGWRWTTAQRGDPVCTVVIQKPETLAAFFSNPNEITLGEAFIHGDLDIEGDIFSVFSVAEHVFNRPQSFRQRLSAKTVRALI